MEFIVRCYHNDGDDNVIGAEVVVYDGDDEISKIILTDETKLNELARKLDNLDSTYVDVQELQDILINSGQSHAINASLFNGMASDVFLKKSDITTYSFRPASHASTSTAYGVGNTNEFGHVKIIDDTTHERYIAGEALSAHQGYELNRRLSTIESNSLKSSLRVLVGRYSDKKGEYGTRIQVPPSGDGIYARILCDVPGFDYTKLTVFIDFNGTSYEFSSSQGAANRKIYPDENNTAITGRLGVNQPLGSDFIVSVFAKYNDDVYPATAIKRVGVV